MVNDVRDILRSFNYQLLPHGKRYEAHVLRHHKQMQDPTGRPRLLDEVAVPEGKRIRVHDDRPDTSALVQCCRADCT